MASSIRVGIIGYGYAGEVIHAPLIQAASGLELVAVSSSRAERQKLAKSNGLAAYGTAQELLADDSIDLVVIATPHDTHLPLTRAAAEVGKHIVCDKLMALDVAEAVAMREAAEGAGVSLSVFHNRRWDGDFLMARQAITGAGPLDDVPRIGELLGVKAWVHSAGAPSPEKWRASKSHGGGIFSDWGAHLIDQALLLHAASVETVSCVMQYRIPDIDVESGAHCVMQFGDGSVHHIETNVLYHEAAKGYEVWGTKGRLVIAGFDPAENELNVKVRGVERRAPDYRAQWYSGDDPTSPRLLDPPPSGDWGAYYENVAGHVLRGERLSVTADSVIAMMRLREAALRAAAEDIVVKDPT